MRYGLIGCGSMGSAIVTGACTSGVLPPTSLHVMNRSADKAHELANTLGATAHDDISSLVDALKGNGIILVAVKPHQISGVIEQMGDDLPGITIVSIAAGIPLSGIAEIAAAGQPLARAMPNVAASIGASTTGIACNNRVSQAHRDAITALFDGVGTSFVIDEDLFAPFSALAGCSPAWLAALANAFAQAGVAHGMTKDSAIRAIAGSMQGTATLLLNRLDAGQNAWDLIDRVCSPGGTTVAGLLAAQDAGLNTVARSAVDAACTRDRALAD